MNIIKQVSATFKWKKPDEYCAKKLGIPLSKYRELKHEIKNIYKQASYHPNSKKDKVVQFKENLVTGEAEIKGITSSKPRSPEEIIKVLNIDTSVWKLSSYWNKESGDKWVVSALVTRLKVDNLDLLTKTLENFKPLYTPVKECFINNKEEDDVAAILSIQDLHFGKKGNKDVIDSFKKGVMSLVSQASQTHKLDKIIYVFGGDILNMDTFTGTTTAGTIVDNDKSAQETYDEAFEAIYWSINYIKQFCNTLSVIYLPGNHDRLSSYHLAHAMSKCFLAEKNITFSAEYAERKVVVYGVNFFGFEHGDVNKKNTPLVYATEFSADWGSTLFRTCYTGHFHSKKTIELITENEYNGFSVKHLPSLSNTDYWHYHKKFVGAKKQAIIECHSKTKGKVSEFIYNVI